MQSGRFGKLNKKVTFPETLDLSPYMSEAGDRADVYRLYAVIVHVDMLNASFFGHYICYVKDFVGNWYRIDDCKVSPFLSFYLYTTNACLHCTNINTNEFVSILCYAHKHVTIRDYIFVCLLSLLELYFKFDFIVAHMLYVCQNIVVSVQIANTCT